MGYRIFTDATADHSPEMMAGLPEVTVLPMEVILNGKSRIYGPGGDLDVAEFYEALRGGATASTTQIRPDVYFKHFTPCLEAGEDILYLCFTSGMSGTYQTAQMCAQELRESFPERTIHCVDTLCASLGQGLLVWYAARMKNEGRGIGEVRDWLEENKLHLCHWFTVDDLHFLKRGGRISAATAVVGSMLQIKPVMHMDDAGHLINVSKARGRKASLTALVDKVGELGDDPASQTMFISHSACLEDAQFVANEVKRRYGVKEIIINSIGPVIGAHTGPGCVALFFMGKHR